MSEGTRQSKWDPVFLHGRCEAAIIFAGWIVALLWAVPYCYLAGYGDAVDPANIETVLGVPSWIFWGVAAPWMGANAFTLWFCFRYMRDDDLGEGDS